MVRNWTCAAPLADPSMTVADTSPFASEADEELLNEMVDEGCQTTGTLGSGRPAASSTRAVNAMGNVARGGPVWLSPPRIRSNDGADVWVGVTAVALTVKLKTVVTMLAPGLNGV